MTIWIPFFVTAPTVHALISGATLQSGPKHCGQVDFSQRTSVKLLLNMIFDRHSLQIHDISASLDVGFGRMLSSPPSPPVYCWGLMQTLKFATNQNCVGVRMTTAVCEHSMLKVCPSLKFQKTLDPAFAIIESFLPY